MRQSNGTLCDQVPRDAHPTPPVGKLLLTVEEARHALGCSLTTVKALIKSGELRSIKLTAKARRVPVDALHEFIAERAA